MADIKSQLITNLDADPSVVGNINEGTSAVATSWVNGGRLRLKSVLTVIAGTQSNADVVRFFRVKSSDVIHSLMVSADLMASMVVTVGLHAVNGGAAVDADCYSTGLILHTAVDFRSEVRMGATIAADGPALSFTTAGQQVWANAGLSSDPNAAYDLSITLTAAGSDPGNILVEALYTAGD